MCSTPRGSGISRRAKPALIDEVDNKDYLKMLQRASSHFEKLERESQKKGGIATKIDEDRSI